MLTSSLVVRLIDQVTGPARKVGGSLLGLNRAANAASGTFGARLGAAIDRNNAALADARGGLVDAIAGFYALKTAIGGPVKEAMAFESAMADVKKVVDFPTPESLKAFEQGLIDLSKRVPLSVNGLAKIAAAAGQAGIAGADLNKFTEAAAKVGVAFDITAEEAGDAMAKLMTGLGLSIDQAILLTDSMNHLSNAQASSAAEILDVVRRVGAQAKMFGYSSTQVSAFASAMISAGAESDVAATSFRNMGLALTKGASATKAQRGAYKALGLDAKKVAKGMQNDAVGTTLDVLERLSKLPKEMQASVASDLFGNEARALGPLLTNLALVKDSLKLVDSQAKFAGSSFKEFEVRAKTFENAVQIFNNRLSALKIVIGAALIPALNDLMGAISPVIDQITSFAQANPELTRNVLAAAAALVSFKIAASALRYIGLIGRGGLLSMTALGFNTIGKAAIAARTAIAGTLAMQAALSGGAAYSGMAKLSDAALAIVRITPGLSLVGPALGAIGSALGAITLPVVAGIAAVAAIGAVIYKYWDRLSATFAGVARAVGEQLAPAFEAARPVLEWLKPVGDVIASGWEKAGAAIRAFGEWIGSFFSREVLSDEQKAKWEQSGYQAATAMIESIKAKIGELIAWFGELPGKILAAVGRIDLGSLIDFGSIRSKIANSLGLGGSEAAPPPANENTPTKSGERAGGGPVWSGGSYLVGENEPEIFSPKKSGTITPASRAGAMNVKIGDVHIHGVTDPKAVAKAVGQELADELARVLRGAHSDSGAWA
jgi:TP901 family phage tail tape measure protein